jgi:hypothetical protein
MFCYAISGLLIIFSNLVSVNIQLKILSTLVLVSITWKKNIIFLTLMSMNIELKVISNSSFNIPNSNITEY